jgi:methylmalonyl-CoA mutase C-terminal domain/subunit
MVAEAALQEDVDVVGLSILSGAHMALVPRVIQEMTQRDIGQLPLFVGGIVPPDDVPALKKLGVREVFGPGTNTQTVVEFIRNSVED